MEGIAGYVQALGAAVSLLFWVAVVSVPLALWKLAEIVIWVARHIRWAA